MRDIRTSGKTKEEVIDEVKASLLKDATGVMVFDCNTEMLRAIAAYTGSLGYQVKRMGGEGEAVFCFYPISV